MITTSSFVGSSRNNLAKTLVGPFIIDSASKAIFFNDDQEWIKVSHAWNRLIQHDPYQMYAGEIFQFPFTSPNTSYCSILLQKQSGDIELDVFNTLNTARKTHLTSVYMPIYSMGNADKNEETITRLLINGIKKFAWENTDYSMDIYVGLLERQIDAKLALHAHDIPFLGFWNPKTNSI